MDSVILNPRALVRPARRIRIAIVASVLVAFGVVSIAPSAFAQAVDIPAMVLPDREAPATAAFVQYGHQFKTDVEDPGTEIKRDNALFSIGHRFDLGEKTNLFALGTYTLHGYDFSGTGATPSVSNLYKWENVHRVVLAGMVGHQVNDSWRILGGGLIRSWGETGADYGDSITGGVIAGFDYRSSDTLTFGLLVGIFSRLEDGVGILPVPTLDWRFTEGWKLHVGTVSVMDPGVGADLSWQVSDEWMLGAGFAFQNREFRLRDKTRAGRFAPLRIDDGGVGQETALPVFATIRWRPIPRGVIDLQGGVALNGNLRVSDNDGDRIADDDYDPAGFLALKGTILF